MSKEFTEADRQKSELPDVYEVPREIKTVGEPGICMDCGENVDDVVDMDGEMVCRECFAAEWCKPLEYFVFTKGGE